MRKPIDWNHVIVLTACAAALGLAAVFRVHGAAFQFLVLFGLIYGGYAVGSAMAPRFGGFPATAIGALGLLAFQSVIQTAMYYAGWHLDGTSDALSLCAVLILSVPLFWIVRPAETTEEDRAKIGMRGWIWMAACLIVCATACAFLIRAAFVAGTTDAIRTPWPLLPAGKIAAFAIASLCVWLSAWQRLPRWFTAVLASLACASAFLVAPLLYQNGFGFDGFLHRASEEIVFATGTLQPKPPYYIGQYVFVTWLARVFDLPIRWTDILTVPLLASLLPFGVLTAFFREKRARWMIAATTLLLPLSGFIATTPQSLAYALGLFALLFAASEDLHPALALVIAGWSLATHPLAGLPFFGACLVVLWCKRSIRLGRKPLRSVLTWILLFGTAASVPLAFFLNGLRSSARVSWNLGLLLPWKTYAAAFAGLASIPRSHAALWPDWATLIAFLLPWLAAGCAIVGARLNREKRPLWTLSILLGFGMVVAGFVLMTSGEFSFLIDYERGNYSSRLFVVALFFFLLPGLDGLGYLAERLSKHASTAAVTGLLFLAAWHGAQFQNALPRNDAAEISRGWSVGHADQEAVRLIDRDAGDRPYTVLANQSVSAAAVEAFGFKRYAGDVFYYPIPTGGPLYQVFLKTAYGDPTRETVNEAAQLGQTDRVYVALNDYWWDAERMNEALASIADRTFEVENGKVKIYRFDFPAKP